MPKSITAFKSYNNALIYADTLANQMGHVYYVLQNAETGKYHVFAQMPMDTYEEEMDGEMQTFELYTNGVNVHPRGK